ncbi:MAG: hypothetical protein Q8Q08_04750 [Candidatus Omnitrophota bacterium]|nr:hypothetical protein [Candidatus Omnitrophota bacterium]MDZ4242228.1 hypothetical protein [Candidatus Omnitrophota bacterium]
MSRHLSAEDSLAWENVCYAWENKGLHREERNALISRELDRINASPTGDAVVPAEKISGEMFPGSREQSAVQPLPVGDAPQSLKKDRRETKLRQLPSSAPKSKLEMGLESYYHIYSEPGLMEQRGLFSGVQGAYTYRLSENKAVQSWRDIFSNENMVNVFKVEGMLGWGYVDFKGDGIADHENDRNYLYEARFLAGYDIPMMSGTRWTPYMGVGYRYLNDNSPGRLLPFTSFSGAFGFERESRYLYLPFGLEVFRQMPRDWTMTMIGEYDLFIFGRQTNHYSDGGPKVNGTEVLDDLTFRQDTGFGLRGSVKLARETEMASFYLEPFIRYWNLKNSETKHFTSHSGHTFWYSADFSQRREGSQAKSDTLEFGLKMGVSY